MKELLLKLGLTDGEIKVYLALNKVGESSIGLIGRYSKVSKSKIYDILDKLIEKGLVGYVVKDGIKHFMANNPEMILDYVNKKEEDLIKIKEKVELIIPELILQRDSINKKPIAEIYVGYHGMKSIRNEIMKTNTSGDIFLTMGCPKVANDILEPYFLEFHKKRVKDKIKMKIIYNSDARKYGEVREKMKLTEVRYLPKEFSSPHWIDIFPETVLFFLLLKEPITFVVRDKVLADSFRSYFDIMWKNSIK